MSKKYIFITGGVVSSLGKGIAAASIAMLLESRGLKVSMLKLDPYLNVDPGTMNPFQHGEVYVTSDGAETDLDLGHYYRFTHVQLNRFSSVTSGQIYDTVIKNERRGDYLGNTVQVVPHITDEIQKRILKSSEYMKDIDVVLVEIGGTIGDIESLPFMEAIRQFRYEHPRDCMNIHLTYVPYLTAAGELKTKPSQHSVQILREIGIIPDMILCRCDNPLPHEIKDKISLFCSIKKDYVFDAPNAKNTIYEVPLQLKKEGLDLKICEFFKLPPSSSQTKDWEDRLSMLIHAKESITIGIVGKYVTHQDAYKSVFEALIHAAASLNLKLHVLCYDSEKIQDEEAFSSMTAKCDGFLIPGGFGERGWLGKIKTATYCREHNIPYFGICLGMQAMAVEFARNVLHLKEANSTEMDPHTNDPVISLLSEQKHIKDLGGSMRLGSYECELKPHTHAQQSYNTSSVIERHRHRYEFNNTYLERFERAGFTISGILKGHHLCEICEIHNHPWMVGVQFHPEFNSKFLSPHPLFKSFVHATHKRKVKS